MMSPASDRPYTVLSCCLSLDGYLGGASGPRWVLSNAADLDRVDELRAGCDAILVGAETIRRDDPRLLVRDARRRHERVAKGWPASPLKVTLTSQANLAADAAFFATGDGPKIVYCGGAHLPGARHRLGGSATVVGVTEPIDMQVVCADLQIRGVRRLLVEGGATTLTQFLVADLADELQVAHAPVFVGDSRAPRFVHDGHFPWTLGRRATLVDAYPVGDVAVHRYALSPRFCAT